MSRLPFVLLCLLSIGCASTGAVPEPFPRPSSEKFVPWKTSLPEAVGTTGGAGGYGIAGTALRLRGVPYRNGGSDPSGFDCSGLIWYVFAEHGMAVPRTVGEQFRFGTHVADGLQPGDLVFFRTTGREVSHVGMAIGGDEFVHAPSSRGEVRVERLGAAYWARRFAGARRY